jgi:biopolymer transport protein ExbD
MRKLRVPQETGDASTIDLTPLLDVVFIMLIFFIVTASFVRETGLQAARSEAQHEAAPSVESMLVRIDAGNEFWIDGLSVRPAALSAHLAHQRALTPDRPLIIQPDAASTARALAQAIDAANLARVTDVAIADVTGAGQF